ncbi:MAG: acyl-CoA dehydrogenase family protein [Deltaproteobacteria bacterium]|nr:acyl-CoA dehydrogenase family protein [Deltaproteobacteria bacterium]MBW2387206.1 acyl-CoA dehydrogenase family protein [Deltaproteobacteria bacterium]MBW2723014.1 acyl-CoA dehydrogenase family protein [Deltaproteobacteria bacterium]
MGLILSEDQLILKQTARSFLEEKSPVSRMHELRDTEDATGFSRALWKEMAEMGWTGIIFPEEFGGAGMAYGELGALLEECGRVLVPEPFMSTVLLGGNAILLGGSDPMKKDLLPGVCSGDRILAMSFQEHGRFNPYAIATRAKRDGDGYRIDGRQQFVLDAHVADQLIVVTRTSGEPGDRDGLTLFVIDADTAGLSIRRNQMLDGRNAADVLFEGVCVGAERVLGQIDCGAELLDAVFDRAAIGLSAEMLGSFEEAFERTLAYLKEREQFGVKIGTFQALRHRVVDMFVELELARSVVREALNALDEGREDVSQMASAAKARCSDVASLITKEAIQMHGGIGMTDEEEIGLFFKRAKAAELTLGDAIYHRDRYASLREF